MTQQPGEFRLQDVDHMTVVGADDGPLLIIDRIVNPSGHWVLTISTGDDQELLQMHTGGPPTDPVSPATGYTVSIRTAAGDAIVDIAGDVLRVWGIVRSA